jgi:prolyl oligopeptidase
MPLAMCGSDPVIEVLHGRPVIDPYRWLEDRLLPETELWIREQQQRYEDYFAMCPNLQPIRGRVRSFLEVEIVDQPARVAGRYFYRRRGPHQEQACIYMRDIATGVERLLVDPSDRGPFTSVSIHRISPTGSFVAYEVKQGGEDKHAIYIFDVERACTLQEKLDRGYARGFSFTSNDSGFYHCRDTQEQTVDHAIHLHLYREPGAESVIFRVARTEESRLILTADTVHLGAILLHRENSEPVVDFFIATQGSDWKWSNVFSDQTADTHPFLHRGRIFLLKGSRGGPRSITELASDGREVRTIIPQSTTAVLQIAIANDMIYASYREDCIPRIESWTLDGKHLGSIDAPKDGSIRLLPSPSSSGGSLFYSHESFDHPRKIFEYTSYAKRSRVWHGQQPAPVIARSNVRCISCLSKDGTEIPLTLVSLGDLPSDRPSPVLLTCYGGFGAAMTPEFSVLGTIMKEFGGVVAIAHIRGGGEFGQEWHDSGRKQSRQNSLDDFIAAAEWLCSHGITTPDRLAAFGGSNAGLVVAATMTQRPKLFAAVLCIGPLLDMVRYHRFDQACSWREEYGTADNVDDFRALYAYSPYHHVAADVDYPPVMFVTGDKDDRCNPAHTRKMAARLQCRTAQTSPIIVDYSEQRGHATALPLSVRVEALTRRIGFLCRELNVSPPAGGDYEGVRN